MNLEDDSFLRTWDRINYCLLSVHVYAVQVAKNFCSGSCVIDFFALIIFLLEVLINTCFYFCKLSIIMSRPRYFINLFTDCADYSICDDSGDLQPTTVKTTQRKEIHHQTRNKKPTAIKKNQSITQRFCHFI